MKVGIWSVRLITVLVCLWLCSTTVRKISSFGCMHQKVVVQCDEYISESTKAAIATFVQEKNEQVHSLYGMTQLLVARFPCITSVAIECNPNGVMYYSIENAKPILKVNQNWTVTDNGRLLLKHCFKEDLTANMHILHVPKGIISKEIITTFASISPDLFEAYDMYWISDHEIYMNDKLQHNFSLLCDSQTIGNAISVGLTNAIKNELASKCLFESIPKKSDYWIADIRFKNQIIVNVGHGGQRYG